MRAIKNKIILRIIFVILMVITVYLISSVLSFKSPHGIDQLEGIYWQKPQTIDAVFMGTSHVHCGINTGLLWEKYGIASYDYSGAEQPLWMTYFYLKELYKYQTPKIVVVDMYAPARFKEDYQYDWISENIHGMRFSMNKLDMLRVSVEFHRLGQYFPSFAVYHGRYDDLGEEDFDSFFWNNKEQEAFKGYTPYWQVKPQIAPVIEETEAGGLTVKSEQYLQEMISLTREKGSRLILIAVPYVITSEDKRTYNRIEEIAMEEGIEFFDYNECYEEIGLDFAQDFNDESHLNYWGSCKFTAYLGAFLKESGDLPDHRGEEGYESWEENLRLIQEEMKSIGSES